MSTNRKKCVHTHTLSLSLSLSRLSLSRTLTHNRTYSQQSPQPPTVKGISVSSTTQLTVGITVTVLRWGTPSNDSSLWGGGGMGRGGAWAVCEVWSWVGQKVNSSVRAQQAGGSAQSTQA
jgi:hypothetical protein